jgi:hypothetical protein
MLNHYLCFHTLLKRFQTSRASLTASFVRKGICLKLGTLWLNRLSYTRIQMGGLWCNKPLAYKSRVVVKERRWNLVVEKRWWWSPLPYHPNKCTTNTKFWTALRVSSSFENHERNIAKPMGTSCTTGKV